MGVELTLSFKSFLGKKRSCFSFYSGEKRPLKASGAGAPDGDVWCLLRDGLMTALFNRDPKKKKSSLQTPRIIFNNRKLSQKLNAAVASANTDPVCSRLGCAVSIDPRWF